MNRSTSLPQYVFLILHLIRCWDDTWLVFLHVGVLTRTFFVSLISPPPRRAGGGIKLSFEINHEASVVVSLVLKH